MNMSYKDFTAAKIVNGDTVTLTPKKEFWEMLCSLLTQKEICRAVQFRFDDCKASVVPKGYSRSNLRKNPASFDLLLKCQSEAEALCIAKHFKNIHAWFRPFISMKYTKDSLSELSSEQTGFLIKLGIVTREHLESLSHSGLEEFFLHDLGV